MNIIVNYINEVLESLDIPVISKETSIKQKRLRHNKKKEKQLKSNE